MVLCALGGWLGCSPPESRLATTRRAMVFEELGRIIVGSVPGAKVLVVGNPFTRVTGADDAIQDAEATAVRGLVKGLGTGAEYLGTDHPELKPGALENPRSFGIPAGASTPLSFLSAPGAWDAVVARHPGTGVLVSLIGLPADLAETQAWTEPGGPRWVLFKPDLRLLGPRAAVETAFREKRLLALVLDRPGAPPEGEPLRGDREAELGRRYLFVTAENLGAMATSWPRLFAAP